MVQDVTAPKGVPNAPYVARLNFTLLGFWYQLEKLIGQFEYIIQSSQYIEQYE